MVEILRELGKGGQSLYAYRRNEQYLDKDPYPMRIVAFTHPIDSVLKYIEAAREPNEQTSKVDVLIHCNDAEAVKSDLLGVYGARGGQGRMSSWITARPHNVIAAWLNIAIPTGLSMTKQLRLTRQLMGLTQLEVGRRIKVSGGYYGQRETIGFSPKMIHDTAKALGVEIGIRH